VAPKIVVLPKNELSSAEKTTITCCLTKNKKTQNKTLKKLPANKRKLVGVFDCIIVYFYFFIFSCCSGALGQQSEVQN